MRETSGLQLLSCQWGWTSSSRCVCVCECASVVHLLSYPTLQSSTVAVAHAMMDAQFIHTLSHVGVCVCINVLKRSLDLVVHNTAMCV